MRRELLTTPTIGSGGNVIGRPRKMAPPDAAQRIEAIAEAGASLKGLALQLGTSFDTLRRWMMDDPAPQLAFDLGRERERDKLHRLVVANALDSERPNINAFFILRNRHGYREGGDIGEGARVNITFNLQAPMSRDDFMKTVASDQ
jgi:hypothetical protein